MNETQLERAVERLYEDPTLRDELIDEEANLLLRWAENHAARLAESVPDEAQFDQTFTALRQVVEQINRFIGYRDSLSEDERQARLNQIAAAADLMGCAVQPKAIANFGQQSASLDNIAAIQQLIALITPAERAESTPPVEPAPPAQPVFQAIASFISQITHPQPDADAPAQSQGEPDPHDKTQH